MSRRSSSAHDLVLEAHDRLAALEAELMEAQTTLRNVTAEKVGGVRFFVGLVFFARVVFARFGVVS